MKEALDGDTKEKEKDETDKESQLQLLINKNEKLQEEQIQEEVNKKLINEGFENLYGNEFIFPNIDQKQIKETLKKMKTTKDTIEQ